MGVTVLPTVLAYVTGGLAYADIHATRDTGATDSDNWRATWTVGGGAEWMIFPRWSIKAEYLYVDFPGTVTTYMVTATSTPVAATDTCPHSSRGPELALLRTSPNDLRLRPPASRPLSFQAGRNMHVAYRHLTDIRGAATILVAIG